MDRLLIYPHQSVIEKLCFKAARLSRKNEGKTPPSPPDCHRHGRMIEGTGCKGRKPSQGRLPVAPPGLAWWCFPRLRDADTRLRPRRAMRDASASGKSCPNRYAPPQAASNVRPDDALRGFAPRPAQAKPRHPHSIPSPPGTNPRPRRDFGGCQGSTTRQRRIPGGHP